MMLVTVIANFYGFVVLDDTLGELDIQLRMYLPKDASYSNISHFGPDDALIQQGADGTNETLYLLTSFRQHKEDPMCQLPRLQRLYCIGTRVLVYSTIESGGVVKQISIPDVPTIQYNGFGQRISFDKTSGIVMVLAPISNWTEHMYFTFGIFQVDVMNNKVSQIATLNGMPIVEGGLAYVDPFRELFWFVLGTPVQSSVRQLYAYNCNSGKLVHNITLTNNDNAVGGSLVLMAYDSASKNFWGIGYAGRTSNMTLLSISGSDGALLGEWSLGNWIDPTPGNIAFDAVDRELYIIVSSPISLNTMHLLVIDVDSKKIKFNPIICHEPHCPNTIVGIDSKKF